MFGFIKKMFTGLFTSIVSNTNHTKCVSLSNQKCQIKTALINLNLNKCSQELHYFSFVVKLGKCVGKLNALNGLSSKVRVPNKTVDMNIHAFNLVI